MRNETTFRVGTLFAISLATAYLVASTVVAAEAVHLIDQGANWTVATRNEFYTRDQGSRIIPLSWINALKQPNGQPFMARSLSRYGYLPREGNPLPVGFNAAGDSGQEMIGMTCAACHTRQLKARGATYRIDGGPSIVDFQEFLTDLDTAVGSVLKDATVFAQFANAILGAAASPGDRDNLRQAVSDWYQPYHTLMDNALPQKKPWGIGRVDAMGMIFNRLAGLDLGQPPSFLIANNIKLADAPVRYPFLWNAAKQDKTQWPGFQENDNDLVRLGRNLGQVYGVFARFHPKKDSSGNMDYWGDNTASIDGLKRLEVLTTYIGAPRWPWRIDKALAREGERVYSRTRANGGCVECHPRPSKKASIWPTKIVPIDDVRTDSSELDLLHRPVDTGVLENTAFFGDPLQKTDDTLRLLTIAVGNSIFSQPQTATVESKSLTANAEHLKNTFRNDIGGYEARVLYGVWAAAPFLHNGSVPTLVELLKPPALRQRSFKIGPAYDPDAVGLAVEQPGLNSTLTTTECTDPRSGNSRCGHDYGTTLRTDEKRALLEYLKSL